MPGQFESILDKLQKKLGKQTIRKASTIARPKPKFEVQQIKLFNEFAKRNPRADGGRIEFDKGGMVKLVEYVESLPKGTTVTLKMVQDYVKKNKLRRSR